MRTPMTLPATLVLVLLLSLAAGCDGAAPEPGRSPVAGSPEPAPAGTAAPPASSLRVGPVDETPVTPEFAGLPAPYDRADYAAGRRTFKLCGSCHTLEAGAPHLMGPNLHGLFGREVGSLSTFGYSRALVEAEFSWTPDMVDAWLANPETFLEGNRMRFSGVRDPGDRKAVIAYLMAETGYGDPPDPSPVAED